MVAAESGGKQTTRAKSTRQRPRQASSHSALSMRNTVEAHRVLDQQIRKGAGDPPPVQWNLELSVLEELGRLDRHRESHLAWADFPIRSCHFPCFFCRSFLFLGHYYLWHCVRGDWCSWSSAPARHRDLWSYLKPICSTACVCSWTISPRSNHFSCPRFNRMHQRNK